VQRPLTSGPEGGQPAKFPSRLAPTFQPLADWLHGHALQEAVTRNLKLEVGGSQTWWLLSHVARPASQHLACYQLN
jgi:hypothetical protein